MSQSSRRANLHCVNLVTHLPQYMGLKSGSPFALLRQVMSDQLLLFKTVVTLFVWTFQ